MSSIEAILLTGGKSRRMGRDKASIPIDGVPQAERIVRMLLDANLAVTILGREPISGAAFQRDAQEFGGPMAALSAFHPHADYVFVASCDLPRFDTALVEFLRARIGDADACTPEVDGFRQPLCALYAKRAFDVLSTLEDHCAMAWLNALRTVVIPEEEMQTAGLQPAAARGANTPEEFAAALLDGES